MACSGQRFDGARLAAAIRRAPARSLML